jgi:hypothetical protein
MARVFNVCFKYKELKDRLNQYLNGKDAMDVDFKPLSENLKKKDIEFRGFRDGRDVLTPHDVNKARKKVLKMRFQ